MSKLEYSKLIVEAKDGPAPEMGFELDGLKFTVPPMSPDYIPASLFAVAARDFDSLHAKIGEFLYELFDWKPELGRKLKRLPMSWTAEFLNQWTTRSQEEFGVDPKAFRSSR